MVHRPKCLHSCLSREMYWWRTFNNHRCRCKSQLPCRTVYIAPPGADFSMGRYLHSWNGATGAKDLGIGNISRNKRAFRKPYRSVLGHSWLSSDRAWKTVPAVCDIYSRVRYFTSFDWRPVRSNIVAAHNSHTVRVRFFVLGLRTRAWTRLAPFFGQFHQPFGSIIATERPPNHGAVEITVTRACTSHQVPSVRSQS